MSLYFTYILKHLHFTAGATIITSASPFTAIGTDLHVHPCNAWRFLKIQAGILLFVLRLNVQVNSFSAMMRRCGNLD